MRLHLEIKPFVLLKPHLFQYRTFLPANVKLILTKTRQLHNYYQKLTSSGSCRDSRKIQFITSTLKTKKDGFYATRHGARKRFHILSVTIRKCRPTSMDLLFLPFKELHTWRIVNWHSGTNIPIGHFVLQAWPIELHCFVASIPLFVERDMILL